MSDGSSGDGGGYKVGNKNPPRHTQFKPGESGNPTGRPKGKRNFKTDLFAELEESTSVRENGRDVTISKQRAVIKSMVSNAMNGDVRAATALSALVERLADNDEIPAVDELSGENQKLLEDFIEREVSRRLALSPHTKDKDVG
jgi:hypothetical protein